MPVAVPVPVVQADVAGAAVVAAPAEVVGEEPSRVGRLLGERFGQAASALPSASCAWYSGVS